MSTTEDDDEGPPLQAILELIDIARDLPGCLKMFLDNLCGMADANVREECDADIKTEEELMEELSIT
eukprot:46708-Eustigmatos_ZCMA.PRE.1